MANFLFTWELGLGLGHLVNLRPLAQGLSARGHRVALALRDLSRAREVFHGPNLDIWQAPLQTRPRPGRGPTLSFANLLQDAGFYHPAALAGPAEAWRTMFRRLDPDVAVFDHSPTALLAARGMRAKRVLLGTGFFCPVDESPLRCLQPWLPYDPADLARDEANVLDTMNRVLATWNQPPLDRVAGLYYPHDENLLVTFPELEHYPGRAEARYRGAWPSGFGKLPEWPAGQGQRIYAYLKPFPELPRLLYAMRRSGCSCLVYCDGITAETQRQFASSSLRFENEPLDMAAVGRECDLAILNANHGTAVSILLAGKPSLQIPIHVEQSLLATAMMRMGAALGASPTDGDQIEAVFARLLADDACVGPARAFAAKYADFDPARQIEGIVRRLEELATRG